MTKINLTNLERREFAMTKAPWWLSEEDGDVCSGESGPSAKCVGGSDWTDADLDGALEIRNAAPVLLEIAKAATDREAAVNALEDARWYGDRQTMESAENREDRSHDALVTALARVTR